MNIQTAQVPAKGGLNLSANRQELLKSPNLAESLVNFEAGLNGGYTQIKGYSRVNTGILPEAGAILGILKYKEGVIACVGTGVYYSTNYTTWYQVNKAETGLTLAAMDASVNTLYRTAGGNYQMKRFVFGNTEKIVLTDGVNKPAVLTIHGETVGTYTIDYEDVDNASVADPSGNEVHLNQVYYYGNTLDPHVVYHSALLEPTDLLGATAGFFALKDKVVGVRLFNKELYAFTPTNISVITGVDTGQASVQPFADDVGCISSNTLQELGGDIIFLAKDGLRTLKTAQQSDTTEAATLSKSINGVLVEFIKNIDDYHVTSTVIREKSQYRLFFTKKGSTLAQDHVGFLAVIDPQGEWSFSTINSFEVNNVHGSHFGDTQGDIFEMEVGNSFNGTDIDSIWETPWFDLGSIGIRKALKDIQLDMILSGAGTVNLDVEFDYNETDIHNPERFEFNFTTNSPTYGTAVYGVDSYKTFIPRFPKDYLEGSGHVIKLTFSGSLSVDEWTLYGFVLDITKGGNI